MNCNDENIITHVNCICQSCTPTFNNTVDNNYIKITPVMMNKLYNCVSLINSEYNEKSIFTFEVDSSDNTYTDNGKVKINTVTVSYDNIGLYEQSADSTKVYFNGQLTDFTPLNLTTVYFQGIPLYLFNDFIKLNAKAPVCCCNNQKQNGTLVSISQKNQFFVISNLKIYVTGCIDDVPFSGVSDFDVLSSTQTLGFSLFNINARLCWPECMRSRNILLKYNPVICADSICPATNYIAPQSEQASFSNGTFEAAVSVLFTNTIEVDILKNEPMPLLTNNYEKSTNKNN